MSGTAIWSLLVFIPSLLFFVCLGYFSLQYHALLYEVSKEKVHQFIGTLKFPASIYKNPQVRELLTSKIERRDFLLVFRILWSLVIIWLFMRGLPAAILRSEGADKLVYITLFLLYLLAFYFSLRFGRILKRSS